MPLTRPIAATDTAQQDYTRARIAHWDSVAGAGNASNAWSNAYHARLSEVYRSVIAPNQRVLEIGCGQGDLLASIEPLFGLGVDFSSSMLRQAARRHPHLRFVQADAHLLDVTDEPFDVVILSDVVNDLWDVEVVFGQLKQVTGPSSRVILNVPAMFGALGVAVGIGLVFGVYPASRAARLAPIDALRSE